MAKERTFDSFGGRMSFLRRKKTNLIGNIKNNRKMLNISFLLLLLPPLGSSVNI